MVSMDGNVVKLIDFGTSKVNSASLRSVSTVPREGISLFFFYLLFLSFYCKCSNTNLVCLALGTVRWGAPETFDYPALWTDKADIYSLGMTFWEIASRKVPFEDVSEPHCTHIPFPILDSFLPVPSLVIYLYVMVLIRLHDRCPPMRESSMLYKSLEGAQRYLPTVLKYPSLTSIMHYSLLVCLLFCFLFFFVISYPVILAPLTSPLSLSNEFLFVIVIFFHCRKEFAAIIRECWRDNAGHRPSSAELLEKLEAAIESFSSSISDAPVLAINPINNPMNHSLTNLTTSYPSTTSSTTTTTASAHPISSPTTISAASTHPISSPSTIRLDIAGVTLDHLVLFSPLPFLFFFSLFSFCSFVFFAIFQFSLLFSSPLSCSCAYIIYSGDGCCLWCHLWLQHNCRHPFDHSYNAKCNLYQPFHHTIHWSCQFPVLPLR